MSIFFIALASVALAAQVPDPYAQADSINAALRDSAQRMLQSEEQTAKAETSQVNSPIADFGPIPDTLGTVKATIDSLERRAHSDSIVVAKKEAVVFKNQSIRNEADFKRCVDPKLACLKFLLSKQMRDTATVVEYLRTLQQWLFTKRDLYYATRLVVPPGDRYLCMGYFKKMQSEGAKVRALLDRLDMDGDTLQVKVQKRLKM